MAYAGGGGAAAAAAAAYIAQATKASGAVVRLEPQEFMRIVAKMKAPLIVVSLAKGGLFSRNNEYLTNYKGIFFYAKTGTALNLPGDAELVRARGFWMPS
jgi:hypothetical protein